MWAHLGFKLYRARWWILALWTVLVALSALLAPRLPGILQLGGFEDSSSEAVQALRLLEKQYPGSGSSGFTIVFRAAVPPITEPRTVAAIEQTLAGLRAHPEVVGVQSYGATGNRLLVSRDETVTYAVVSLTLRPSEAATRLADFTGLLQRPSEEGLEMWITGAVAISRDISRVSEEDLQRAERATFPLALGALLLVFRTLVAAALPLLLAAATVTTTLALLWGVGHWLDLSVFVLNISSLLGLGIAIDYSLFLVSRFREEMERGEGVAESLAATMATAGRAVVFSGSTVFIGLLGLLFFPFVSLRSMGIGGGLVAFISVLAALTLLPALLSVLGSRVNALPLLPRRRGPSGGLWRRMAVQVMAHPWPVFLLLLLGLIFLGTPIFRLRLGTASASALPARVESRQGEDVLAEAFGPGETSPLIVVLTAERGARSPEVLEALSLLRQRLADDPRIARVETALDLLPGLPLEQVRLLLTEPAALQDPRLLAALSQAAPGLDVAALSAALGQWSTEEVMLARIYPAHPGASPEAQELVRLLRGLELPSGVRVRVTGASAFIVDFIQILYQRFSWVVVAVVGVIYLALVFTFGSLVIPLKAVLMNTLSILASYGALVFIFQEGHLSQFLGFRAEGYVESVLPILLFCILFGLSMDYEVFLLSRIKEAYERSGDNRESVALGMERTGAIITSAALILVIVGGSFALADIVIIKSVGLGLAIAIALDATLIRAFLVPATMRLLGDLNWWAPAPLRRLIGHGAFATEGRVEEGAVAGTGVE